MVSADSLSERKYLFVNNSFNGVTFLSRQVIYFIWIKRLGVDSGGAPRIMTGDSHPAG
jgi:hypothetical protein